MTSNSSGMYPLTAAIQHEALRTHSAPDGAFSVGEAHREMQVHRDCRLDECARKATAFQTLIDAGRVTPDSARQPR
ncbi:hypothetical protein AB0H71_26165 [Nocardia sp. NPDC050697]|uniref:hypothetical protein n=1 Tax=Nocardia sp. NPDC050697 TaxID=3155158 RepID=UPI0033E18779